jgi:hypothetical protein
LAYRVRIGERVLAMFDPCPPDIGSVSKDVPRRLISLENKDLTHGHISVDKHKWWSKWWSDP